MVPIRARSAILSFLSLSVAVLIVLVGVTATGEAQTSNSAAESSRDGQIRFENRQPQSGVGFVLDNGATPNKPMIDTTLGGVALFDFDNDGFLDIFFTNGAHIPSLIKNDETFHNRLYRNNHDGKFTDVTARAGVSGSGYSMGAAAGDFNNDGWTDLYVTGVNRNVLYRNNGDGTFTDVTDKAGVAGLDIAGKKLWSVSGAWLDYDNDGNLDLFVANYLDWSFMNAKICGWEGDRTHCGPEVYRGLPSFLYRNDGDGTFTDVSAASKIADQIGKGMGVAVADLDGDGFMDIFLANDRERDMLFRNLDGRTFAEVGVESSVAFTEDGLPVASMGVDFRDVNNDGRPDLFVTTLSGETYPLFLNDGQGFFTDVSYKTGIGRGTFSVSGWGTGAYDFDNDGHKDLFTANSHVTDNIDHYTDYEYKQPNLVFRNQGNGTFRDVTPQAGPTFQSASAHRGSAFGDLDNDGRIDVVVSVIGQEPEIFYNTSTDDHHWILIQTEGTQSNRDGIGTRIKVTGESGLVQYNHVTTSVGYASSSDRRVHFGLGKDSRIREIELRWPSGKVQVLKDVAADQILKVTEE